MAIKNQAGDSKFILGTAKAKQMAAIAEELKKEKEQQEDEENLNTSQDNQDEVTDQSTDELEEEAVNYPLLAIDISKHQGTVDFDKVYAAGIRDIILRIGYTGYGTSKSKNKDSMFETYYAECQRLGIRVGIYWYSCAVTTDEAITEANKALAFLNDRSLQAPVFFDTEDNHDISKYSPVSQYSLAKSKGKQALTDIAVAFCKTIQDAGYLPGVYASKSWYLNQLNYADLSQYAIWVAQYNSECTFAGHYDIWQYSSSGLVAGITGNVDMNKLYRRWGD